VARLTWTIPERVSFEHQYNLNFADRCAFELYICKIIWTLLIRIYLLYLLSARLSVAFGNNFCSRQFGRSWSLATGILSLNDDCTCYKYARWYRCQGRISCHHLSERGRRPELKSHINYKTHARNSPPTATSLTLKRKRKGVVTSTNLVGSLNDIESSLACVTTCGEEWHLDMPPGVL
jgi:hypothetical protein